MDRDQVIQIIVKRARIDRVEPQRALEGIADLIGRLDMLSPDYEQNVESLVEIGACLWQLGTK